MGILPRRELHLLALKAGELHLRRDRRVRKMQHEGQPAEGHEVRRAVAEEGHMPEKTPADVDLPEGVAGDEALVGGRNARLRRERRQLFEEVELAVALEEAPGRRVLERERGEDRHVEHRDVRLGRPLVNGDEAVRLVPGGDEDPARHARIDGDGLDFRRPYSAPRSFCSGVRSPDRRRRRRSPRRRSPRRSPPRSSRECRRWGAVAGDV